MPCTSRLFLVYSTDWGLGGTIIIWKNSRFTGHIIFQNSFAMSIEFIYAISDDQWVLTNIYAPCTPYGKQQFLD
jgi:hypothetical protein